MSLYPMPLSGRSAISRESWWSTSEDRHMVHQDFGGSSSTSSSSKSYLGRHVRQAQSDALYRAVQEGLVCLDDVLECPIDWNTLAMEYYATAQSQKTSILSARRNTTRTAAAPSPSSPSSTAASTEPQTPQNGVDDADTLLRLPLQQRRQSIQMDNNKLGAETNALKLSLGPLDEHDQASSSVRSSPTAYSFASLVFTEDGTHAHNDRSPFTAVDTPSTVYSPYLQYDDGRDATAGAVKL